MNFKIIGIAAIASLLSFSVAAPTIAQDAMMLHGDEAIAERKAVMRSNGGVLRGAGDLSGDEAIAAGQTLVDNFTKLADLFPEDSMGGDTKALPAIWEDSEGFMVAFANAQAAAAGVLAAAESMDAAAYADALKAIGVTCGACHGTYRAQ